MIIKDCNGILVICFLHLMHGNKAVNSDTDPNIFKLFHEFPKAHAYAHKRENIDLNFAEGSSHNRNSLNNSDLFKGLNDSMDLLSMGAPGTGTSGIKPRKGVDEISFNIQNTSSTNWTNNIDSKIKSNSSSQFEQSKLDEVNSMKCAGNQTCLNTHSRKVSSTSLSTDSKNFNSSFILPANSTNVTYEKATSVSNQFVKLKKPLFTTAPIDSDSLAESMIKDKNVVIPVVALVIVPLLVLLLLLIYKRIQDSKETYYVRMGYLIEDIYND